MKPPKKTIIRSAFVYFAGERAAGLQSATFKMETWIDLGCWNNDEWVEVLESIKKSILKTYEEMLGERPTWVMFDYETEAEQEEP